MIDKAAVLALLAAPAFAAGPSAAPLLAADRALNKATQERGVEGWMSFMADDVVLLRAKPVVGKDAVRAEVEKMLAGGARLTWEPKRGELFPSGDLGHTSGRYTFRRTGEDGKPLETRGSYLTVWQKQPDGAWNVIWDGGSADPRP